jgi:phage terminase large subunit
MGHWPFKLDDNPNLDPDVVAAIKQENVGVYYKRYVMGEWVQAEGAIYDNWNEKVHVVYRMPRIMRWMSTGVDYGRVNPFVALLLGLGEDGRVYVTSELRWDSKKQRMQKDDQQYSRDYQQWLATYPGYADGVVPEWTLVDPTARSFLVQLYKDGVSGVRDAENEVGDGIRTVARALGQDRLRIHASCTGLIEEFPAYAWDEKAAERGIDQPLKQNDHSLDALRYGLMGTRHIWEQTTLRDAEPVEEP